MKHHRKRGLAGIAVFLLGLAVHAYGQIGAMRVWTDAKGRKMEAELLKIEAEAVLVKVGTKEVLLDLDKLSSDDRIFVEGLRRRVPPGQVGALRMWTDVQGRQVEARLLRILDADSIIVKVRTKEYTMKLDRLSEADRKYVDGLRPEPPAGQVLEYPIHASGNLAAWLEANHMRSLQWKGVPRPHAEEYFLPFQLHVPPETDKNRGKKLPLLVHLHGTGGIGTDNLKQFSCGGGVAKLYMAPAFQEDQATYIMIPQTAQMSGWTSLSYTDPSYAMRAIVHAIRILAETPGYRIDLTQVYITGLSMGGTGVYQAMAKFPGFFAGGVPISSISSSRLFHEGNVGPLWIVINRGDRNLEERLNYFRRGYEAVGGTLHTTVNDKKGHDAWNSLVRDPKFRDWLFRRHPEMYGQ